MYHTLRSCTALTLLAWLTLLPSAVSGQSCTLKYDGPATGTTTVLQPGHSVGGTFYASTGSQVSSTSSTSLDFTGRTGEKTFGFEQEHESKTFVLGRTPEPSSDTKALSVYWEGSTVPIKLAGYTFTLALETGEVRLTMLDHPSEGPCPSAGGTSAAPTAAEADILRLVREFGLDLANLQRQGFDPAHPKLDQCLPSADRTLVTCTGRSEARSAELCRADAMAPLMGMATAGRQNHLAAAYTLTCPAYRVTVQRSLGGAVTVDQVEASSGVSVFSRAFTY
jgi:hypothetical protein